MNEPNKTDECGPLNRKLATLDTVREISEGEPVELWLNDSGRVVVRAWNECGNAYTEIDAIALMGALRGWTSGGDSIEVASL